MHHKLLSLEKITNDRGSRVSLAQCLDILKLFFREQLGLDVFWRQSDLSANGERSVTVVTLDRKGIAQSD